MYRWSNTSLRPHHAPLSTSKKNSKPSTTHDLTKRRSWSQWRWLESTRSASRDRRCTSNWRDGRAGYGVRFPPGSKVTEGCTQREARITLEFLEEIRDHWCKLMFHPASSPPGCFLKQVESSSQTRVAPKVTEVSSELFTLKTIGFPKTRSACRGFPPRSRRFSRSTQSVHSQLVARAVDVQTGQPTSVRLGHRPSDMTLVARVPRCEHVLERCEVVSDGFPPPHHLFTLH